MMVPQSATDYACHNSPKRSTPNRICITRYAGLRLVEPFAAVSRATQVIICAQQL
jgi:hypothetical protein